MAGLAGRIFGGYELTSQIAGGGIAEVYRGRPTKPGGRDVVVKVFYPEFARQPGFKAHFRHIVQMSAQLANHPHILPLLAGDEDGGYLYLVTPFVSNGTLKDWLGGGGRMTAHDIAPFFRQLCDALTHAHNHGVIHGNVKPSNICLYEGRHVLLGDFGLLWDPTQVDMDHSGSGAEAVEFMAPEVISGQQTQLSDVYSVGAVLYCSIIGVPPFRGARLADVIAAHRHQPVPRLEQINPLLSPGLLALDAVIQRAMGKRPEDRYPSAAAMALAIETAVHQAPQSPPQQPQSPPQQPAPPQPVSSSFLLGMPAQSPAPQHPAAPVIAPGAIGSAALPAGSVPLQPLNPPFPPLPPMAAAQEAPEAPVPPQFAAPGAASDVLAPAPPPADASAETTMRVPAPAPPVPPAEPAPFSWSGGAFGDDNDMPSQQEMPAIRIPAIQRQAPGPGDSASFDAWDGSTAGLDPLSANDPRGHASLANDAFASAPLYQPPEDGSYSGALDWAESGEQRGWPALGLDGDGNGDDDLVDRDLIADWTAERNAYALADADNPADFAPSPAPSYHPEGFSPTQLGLPRLTSPAMPAPSQWRDIVSDSLQMPAFDAPHGGARNDEPLRWTDAGETMWERSGFGDQGNSMEMPQPHGHAAAASGLLDPVPSLDELDAQGAHVSARGGFRGRHMQPEPVVQPDFDDERDWTRGVRSLRRPRRWPRKVALIMVLVLLLDLFVVVLARPDLCPNANCHVVSAFLRQRVALALHTGILAGPLTVAPVALNISTTSNSTTTTSLMLTNGSSTPASWSASASLSWIKVTPAQGTLAPGASTTLTATIGTEKVRPGPYTGTVAITSGQAKGSIPVTVAVGAAAALSATPTSLSFSKCGGAQTITLKNGGGSPLTYQAVPSQSNVLSLKGSSGSIPAGGSAKITVTLTCDASHGTDYTVNITSTNGSTVVPVHYP